MATRGKKPAHKMEVTHRTELSFPVDKAQIKAIQKCLEKGELKITVNKVDMDRGGKFKGAYEYD